MNKRIVKITAIILSVVIVAGGGYYGLRKYQSSKAVVSTNNYLIETVKKGQIDVGIQATGTVFAGVTKEIVTNNSGELKDLTVKVGDAVKSGAKLFKVESEQIKQQLTSAELNLEKQKLQLEIAQAEVNTNIEQTEAGGNKAQTEQDKKLESLSIEEAQNSLNNAKEQYNKMTVKAPISGLVTVRNGNIGDTVQSGKSILSIIDTTSLKVKASIDELDIAKVAKDQKVTVKLNALPDKSFEGYIESISEVGTTQNNVTSYEVIVALKDSVGIKLGMTASVNIEIASKQDALLVPLEALTQRNGKYYVMTAASDVSNTADKTSGTQAQNNTQPSNGSSESKQAQSSSNGQQRVRPNGNTGGMRTQSAGNLVEVKIGLQNENYAEVTEGLAEGQRVLITVPQGSSTTTNTKVRNMGGLEGGFGGSMPAGGTKTQGTRP